MSCNHNFILNLRHTRIDFLQLKLGVILTAKTAMQAMKAQNHITKVILQDIFI